MNPVGSKDFDDSSATAATSVEATVSTTSDAVDRTASAASEIRREKSLTDNFCAVREDAVDLATGAKAVQLVADVARMQRRELAIDDFMIIAAVYCSIMVAVCPAAAALVFFVSVVLVPKKQHRQSRTNSRWEGSPFSWERNQTGPSTSSPDSFRTNTMDALSIFSLQSTFTYFNFNTKCPRPLAHEHIVVSCRDGRRRSDFGRKRQPKFLQF